MGASQGKPIAVGAGVGASSPYSSQCYACPSDTTTFSDLYVERATFYNDPVGYRCVYTGHDYTYTTWYEVGNQAFGERTNRVEDPRYAQCYYDSDGKLLAGDDAGGTSSSICYSQALRDDQCFSRLAEVTRDEDLAKNYYRCSGSGCEIETAECYRCPTGDRPHTSYANVTISGDRLNCDYQSKSTTYSYNCEFDGTTGKLGGVQTNCASGTQAPKGLVCEQKRIARVMAEMRAAALAIMLKEVETAGDELLKAFCKACPALLSEKNSTDLIPDKDQLAQSCQFCATPETKPGDVADAFVNFMSEGQPSNDPWLYNVLTSSPSFLQDLTTNYEEVGNKLG